MPTSLYAIGVTAVFAVASAAALAAGSSKPAVYTSSQAQSGSSVYSGHCARCHGNNLQGSVGPALMGSSFEKSAQGQGLNGATLLSFISQHMPLTNPGSLDKKQYDEVTAFILKKNGYPSGNNKLSSSEPKLKDVNFSAKSPCSSSS